MAGFRRGSYNVSVKITDLGAAVLPLVGTEQLELAVSSLESRRVAVSDLLATIGGLDATFVTITANPSLPNERILTAGTGISIVDGGAGLPVTISAVVPPAGDLPIGVDMDTLYADSGGWLASSQMRWDEANRSLSIDGGVGSTPVIQMDNLSDVATAIEMHGTGGFQYLIFKAFDQGTGFFELEHDYSGSNDVLRLSSDLGLLQTWANTSNTVAFPQAGVTMLGGTFPALRISSTSMIQLQERASVPFGIGFFGQVWVRNDALQKLMFTDEAGTDFVLNSGAGISGAPVNNELAIWVDASNIEGDANLTFDGANLQSTGVIAGDLGTEGSGITIGGVLYDSTLKASALGGTDEAQFIMHRHSTTLGPVIVGARSNTNDATHSTVLDNQDLLVLAGVGWDGANYEFGALMRIAVDGTPGVNDMPSRFEFATTPVGSAVAVTRLTIDNQGIVLLEQTLSILERAAAPADVVGRGQFWVRNDAPNTPMFTDDVGTDFDLSAGVVSFPLDALDNEQIRFGTSQDVLMYFNATNMILAQGDIVTHHIGDDATPLLMTGPITAADKTLNVQCDTENGQVRYHLAVDDPGGNNRRCQFWLNDLTGAWGLASTASSGVPEFQILQGAPIALSIAVAGTVLLRSVASTDTESRQLQFAHQDGTERGMVGYTTTSDLNFIQRVHGALTRFYGEDAGGTLREMVRYDGDSAVNLGYNGTFTLRTADETASDIGMGAEVMDNAGTFRPVGMNVAPPETVNAGMIFAAVDNGQMKIHDEATARSWTVNQSTDIPLGAIYGIINIGAGVITLVSGVGVAFEYWNGTGWTNTTGNITLGLGQFTIYKRTDIEYVVNGPNIS